MARVAFISRMDERNVRLAKLLATVAPRSECVLVGWSRFDEDWAPGAVSWQREILRQPTGEGLLTARHLPGFLDHVERALRKHRADLVVAINDEVGWLAGRYKGKLFGSLVLDLEDELEARVRTRNPLLKAALRWVAEAARAAADRILSVDARRLELLSAEHRRKAVVVPNYPRDAGPALWRRLPQGPARVFVGGALARTRGLPTVLRAAGGAGVGIVSAGRLMDSYAAEVFVRSPLVSYVGCLRPEEALEAMAGCDLAVALYEPGPQINRLAAPNKVYDALCVGRPILVNREMDLSRWIEEQQIGFAAPYGDVETIGRIFSSLPARRAGLASFAARARRLFDQGYSWKACEPVVLSALEQALAAGRGA